MFKKYSLTAGLIIMAIVFLTALPAISQEQNMNPGSQVQDTQVSDANLKKAATAYTEVAKISQQFQQQIQGVENQEKIRNLQQSANNQMIDAIESQDLDLETYNSILEKVRVDEEIRAKFMNIAQSMQ